MKREDIYRPDIASRSGSEQSSRRSVIVVSHDGFNQAPGWCSDIVVPVSTLATRAMRGPTAFYLPKGAGGLKKAGIALCHQVTTLDRAKLTERMGTLSPDLLSQIEDELKAAMDLQ